MTDAPKRIWTAPTDGKCHVGFDTPSLNYTNEYILAPEVAALIREAEARGMERAAELAWQAAGRCETQAKNFGAMEGRERQFWEWTARSLGLSALASTIRAAKGEAK